MRISIWPRIAKEVGIRNSKPVLVFWLWNCHLLYNYLSLRSSKVRVSSKVKIKQDQCPYASWVRGLLKISSMLWGQWIYISVMSRQVDPLPTFMPFGTQFHERCSRLLKECGYWKHKKVTTLTVLMYLKDFINVHLRGDDTHPEMQLYWDPL